MDNYIRFDMQQVNQLVADNAAAKQCRIVPWEKVRNRMASKQLTITAKADYVPNVIVVDFKTRKRIG